jgi:hypothetical protein
MPAGDGVSRAFYKFEDDTYFYRFLH